MAWSQLEPTPAHLTYLVLTSFLLVYALFSVLVRNRLHLSEPPLATIWVSQPGAREFPATLQSHSKKWHQSNIYKTTPI